MYLTLLNKKLNKYSMFFNQLENIIIYMFKFKNLSLNL